MIDFDKSRQENAFIAQVNAGIADEEERFDQGEIDDEGTQ